MTPLECLDVLVRFYYGDLRPPPEPVVPAPQGDARCADDCERIAGQVGLTFDGSVVPVRWTMRWEDVCNG